MGALGAGVRAIGALSKSGGGGLPALQALDFAKKSMPTLEQEADVCVYGRPGSTKADLYWIAVSIAFGLISRRDISRFGPPAGLIALEYNCEHQRVRFTVRQVSAWHSVMATIKEPGNTIQLFKGPPNETVGGAWQWNAGALPSSPGKLTALGFTISDGWEIKTGYEGRVMITPNPTYKDARNNLRPSASPSPRGDGTSRGLPTLASHPAVRALDTAAWYTSPEYLLFTALRGPCDAGPQTFDAELRSPGPASVPQPFADPTLTAVTNPPPINTALTSDPAIPKLPVHNPNAGTTEYPPPGTELVYDGDGFGTFKPVSATPLGFNSLPPGTLPLGGFQDLSQTQ